jgi:hypothetical protein
VLRESCRKVLKVTDRYCYHIGYLTLTRLPWHVDLAELRQR